MRRFETSVLDVSSDPGTRLRLVTDALRAPSYRILSNRSPGVAMKKILFSRAEPGWEGILCAQRSS